MKQELPGFGGFLSTWHHPNGFFAEREPGPGPGFRFDELAQSNSQRSIFEPLYFH
jgi:hypothetical protein